MHAPSGIGKRKDLRRQSYLRYYFPMRTGSRSRKTYAALSSQHGKATGQAKATDPAAPEVVYVPVSATVPQAIAQEARARFGKRNLSKFIARAMARELVREARDEYLAKAGDSPIDQGVYREFMALLES